MARAPSGLEAGAQARAHLAEHLVPVEDSLPLLLHLQLPPLLGALHALQDRVGSGSPEGGHGGSHGASVLQWEEMWGLRSNPKV